MKHFLAAAFLLAATGCGSDGNGIELPDWSDGYPQGSDAGPQPDGGGVMPGGLVSIRIADGYDYDKRFGRAINQSMDCAIDTSAASFSEEDCRLDLNELDLYFNGFGYTIGVPAETCDYIAITNYMYQAWEAGTGPALVHFKVDENGNFLSDVSGSLNGEPFCEFDHQSLEPDNPDAPNCCFGTYQTLVTVVDAGGGETNQPLTNPESWGGTRIGDCYAGAAYTSNLTEIDEASGLPRTTIVDVDETVDSAVDVTFDAPIAKPESSNITVANFLDPDDDVPVGLDNPNLEFPFAQPEYLIECLDHAQEVSARFHLVVREWDQVAEFDANGDPDTGRKSSSVALPPLESNGSGSPINDYFDWSDFIVEGNPFVHEFD
jgi:hypothetical protein